MYHSPLPFHPFCMSACPKYDSMPPHIQGLLARVSSACSRSVGFANGLQHDESGEPPFNIKFMMYSSNLRSIWHLPYTKGMHSPKRPGAGVMRQFTFPDSLHITSVSTMLTIAFLQAASRQRRYPPGKC